MPFRAPETSLRGATRTGLSHGERYAGSSTVTHIQPLRVKPEGDLEGLKAGDIWRGLPSWLSRASLTCPRRSQLDSETSSTTTGASSTTSHGNSYVTVRARAIARRSRRGRCPVPDLRHSHAIREWSDAASPRWRMWLLSTTSDSGTSSTREGIPPITPCSVWRNCRTRTSTGASTRYRGGLEVPQNECAVHAVRSPDVGQSPRTSWPQAGHRSCAL